MVTINIEPVKDTYREIDLSFLSGTNSANFMLADHRSGDFPRLDLCWDVNFNDKKVQKIGILDFINYYNNQIETTLKSKTMALVNSRNDDVGLRFLAQIKLKVFKDDE